MRDSLSIISTHCAQTLPDSLSARKELLVALITILTAEHPAHKLIAAQLAAIEAIESLQKELPLKFTGIPKHDGH